MRVLTLVLASMFSSQLVFADVRQIWTDLQSKREGLKAAHQEFKISHTLTFGSRTQSSNRTLILDFAPGMWRQSSKKGSAGSLTRLFAGKELIEWRDGETEFTSRSSHRGEQPQPSGYDTLHLDLAHGVELARKSCGFSTVERECVTLQIPMMPYTLYDTLQVKSPGGVMMATFDIATGLLISLHSKMGFDRGALGYTADTVYALEKLTINAPFDPALFTRPASVVDEVKQLPTMSAEKINKQLAGKPAPDVTLTDIQGNALKLSALKGKTVLLDFWTTWCEPCRADGPALDKLYKRYGGKNLAIVGISVDEEHSVVQQFLAEHPHQYPVVLTTENELPSTYAIVAFPTYLVIDPEGNIASASSGTQGFSQLRHELKKAGMESD